MSEKRLVVFRPGARDAPRILSEVLDLDKVDGPFSRRNIEHLGIAGGEAEEVARYYGRLHIGVGVLNEHQADVLLRSSDVISVEENAVREIPPIPELREGTVFLHGGADNSPSSIQRDYFEIRAAALNCPGPQRTEMLASTATSLRSWCLSIIGLDGSVDGAPTEGEGAKVAILDTGIDSDHPDFSDCRDRGAIQVASFVPHSPVFDGHGHGTHCAGIIVGQASSSGGLRYGVAPETELAVGKVLDDQGKGRDDAIVDGIDWAVDAGARVISLSLGACRALNEPASGLYETIAQTLLDEGLGVLIVAAAGNGSDRPDRRAPVWNPAACDSIMAIAAIDRFHRVSKFSCAGLDDVGKLSLCAPGVDVHSCWPGGGYRKLSGTSMATPHVSGVAALLIGREPKIPARRLRTLLEDSTKPIGDPVDFGSGLLCCVKAHI